jgi:hypothetical protein
MAGAWLGNPAAVAGVAGPQARKVCLASAQLARLLSGCLSVEGPVHECLDTRHGCNCCHSVGWDHQLGSALISTSWRLHAGRQLATVHATRDWGLVHLGLRWWQCYQ